MFGARALQSFDDTTCVVRSTLRSTTVTNGQPEQQAGPA
jgi:hypothetical protein